MHQGARIKTRRRPPPNPHDALFRGIFRTPARAAELLRSLMPARRAQGIRKGIRKGQRALLQAQLEERFGPLPPKVLSRLAAATGADLDRWARRILRAKTLAATLS